jgi:multidrug efflux pump subunit AcrB
VAIFIPVVFMEGVIGKFFLQFGVTLCVAVLLSYLEAITLAPARCSQILDGRRGNRSASAAPSTAPSTLWRAYLRPRAGEGAAAPRVVLAIAAGSCSRICSRLPQLRASSSPRRTRAGS